MNKLMGFLELRRISIPSIKWKQFSDDTVLDKDRLWTIRSAVYSGKDISLPRMVGKSSEECTAFALSTMKNLRDNGFVLYYPYFIADKSGTLMVLSNKVVIEAVKGDLWNLVNYNRKDITIYDNVSSGTTLLEGNTAFLSEQERSELYRYLPEIRRAFKDEIFAEKGIILEWSFARDCDNNGNPVGDPYLVFYEVRSVGI